MNALWRRTSEEADYLHNCPNHAEMSLIYGRIYTPRAGYNYSDTNNLINNFKKSPKASSPELHYKKKAIEQFASELAILATILLVENYKAGLAIVPMPPSKIRSHPEYDDRVEQVARMIANRLKEQATYFPVLLGSTDRDAAHLSGSTRDPEVIYRCMTIDESIAIQYDEKRHLVVIDDVLTSGAHFAAAYRHLHQRFPEARITGVFWAKSQSPSDFGDPPF